ncbi:MAG: LacI family DNA-binding transcriptional regulator [Clostridia bacterium]|nr:LacI family DNA-binding transcriptional regulator [Clostridia bacterium]MDD4679833.1 LacI family DNA-binding transcriptional regulator [Clostridia bacterium]
MKKVTIKDVAREANISVGTVYRAINNTGRIKDETRDRILEIVERLGYKANTVARGLALRKKFNILVIMPCTPEIFWDEVRIGTKMAAEELLEFGVKIIEFIHNDSISKNASINDIIANNDIDAIAMSIVNFNDSDLVLSYAEKNVIPIAIFDEDTINRKRLFYYGPDYYQTGKIAAELMYKFCNRSGECCIISSTNFWSGDTSYKRVQGFLEHVENNYPDFHIVGSYRCTLAESSSVVLKAMKDHPEAKGFYFDQYRILLNNYKIFEKTEKDYVVIGHEYEEEYKKALQEGTITAILAQERVCQGYYPVIMLYNYLITGEKPDRDSYYSNTNIIIGANADNLQHSKYGCGYE